MVTAVDESEVFTDDELVANPILVHIVAKETASGAACLALTTLQAIPRGRTRRLRPCIPVRDARPARRRPCVHRWTRYRSPPAAGTRPHSARGRQPRRFSSRLVEDLRRELIDLESLETRLVRDKARS